MAKRTVLGIVVVLALAIGGFVAACGGGDEGSGSTGDGGTAKLKFVMCVADPSTPYVQAFIAGAEDEAKKLGVEIDVEDGHRDSIKIMDIMDAAIVKQADGFIQGGAIDLKAIVPGVERLNEAGIPIIAIDTSPEGGKVDMFISFDIKEATVKATEQFVNGIKERNGGTVPKGVVIEITGAVQDMFTQECLKGFKEVISQYPQLKVAQADGQWSNDVSNQRTADLLTRYGDEVLGVYVHTPDIMGPGAIAAIKAAGKDPADYGMSGICIGPEGIDMLNKGEMYAAVEQPAYDTAVLAVQYLADICNDKPIPKVGDTVEEEGAIWSPAQVIDNPWADGAFMVLQGPLVPQEIGTDDSRLWEVKLQDLWQ
jgi:ribose transport system substrate-binding protein